MVIALHRLPMPRFAFTRRDLLTRVGLAHGPARTVGCCFKKDRPVAARHAFGHRLPPSRCVPMGGTDLSRRGLARSRTASTSEALLTRAAPRLSLIGLVPLCCGGERKATDYHDMCDGMLYPRMTACEAAPRGCPGPLRAAVTAREGPSRASPGTGLSHPVQLASPRPLSMAVLCLQCYNRALCAKVNVGVGPPRRRTSLRSAWPHLCHMLQT